MLLEGRKCRQDACGMKCEKNERARVPRITGGAGGYLGRRLKPTLLKGKRAGETPAVRTAKAKMPAGGQRYEPQMCKQVWNKKRRGKLGALRLRQRGCGFGLWRGYERLRCT